MWSSQTFNTCKDQLSVRSTTSIERLFLQLVPCLTVVLFALSATARHTAYEDATFDDVCDGIWKYEAFDAFVQIQPEHNAIGFSTGSCGPDHDGLSPDRTCGITPGLSALTFQHYQQTGPWPYHTECHNGVLLPAGVACPSGTVENLVTGKCDRPVENPFKSGGGALAGSCPVMVGNPVNVGAANKLISDIDYQGTGVFPLSWLRSYNSIDGVWRFGYAQEVETVNTDEVILWMADGKGLTFKDALSNGNWTSDADVPISLSYDTVSDLWTATHTDDSVEIYNVQGQLVSLSNRAGQIITLSYTNDLLTTATHFSGRSISVTHNVNNQVETVTDPGGNVYSYTYDLNGMLEFVVYPDDTPLDPNDNARLQYHYEDLLDSKLVTGVTDELGVRFATYSYDSEGRPTETEHFGGLNENSIAYNVDDSVTVTNPLGKVTDYDFVLSNGVRKVVTTDGQPTTLCGATTSSVSYDANGYISSRTDENGNIVNLTYNAAGLIEAKVEAVGEAEERITTTTWHSTFRVPTQIVYPGQAVDMTYDSSGRLLSRTLTDTQTQTIPYITTGNTRTWVYTYNAAGLLESVDGPRTDVSDITTYAYDINGDLLTTTNSLNQVTEILARDGRGLPTQIEDINDVVSTLAYDERGRLTSRTIQSSQGNSTTSFDYDAAGQVIRITLPNNSYLDYEYDNAHRLTAVENNLGERIEYVLDSAGNRTGEVVKDASSTITRSQTQVFDELSRLREMIGASSQTNTYDYDNNGNLDSITDGENNVIGQSFDGLDRVVAVSDPNLNDTNYVYDSRDNVSQITDPRGIVTSYIHDGLDNLIQEVSPDAGNVTYQYDEAGNIVQKTDARGVVSQLTYDALDRLASVSFPNDPSENVTYVYDVGTNAIGRLSSMSDASGSSSFSYDDRGNVIAQTKVINGISYAVSYAYDIADSLLVTTYPSGRTLTYTRDALGRVSAVDTQAPGSVLESVISNISYAPFGPATGWSYGNGIVESRSYDLDYRVVGIASGGVLDRSYSYDLNNSITVITNGLNGSNSQAFVYDSLLRLEQAAGVYGTINYSYDENGNRLTRDHVSGSDVVNETYSYDLASNRLNDISRDDNGSVTLRTLSYDGAGSITTDNRHNGEIRTNTYNAHARLEDVSAQTSLGTYKYNAMGQRVAKATATETIHFVYSLTGQLLAEINAIGYPIREYLYANDQLVGVVNYTLATTEDVILDNGDVGTSEIGTWITKTNQSGERYGSTWLRAKNSSASYRWEPNLAGGDYNVYAWWVDGTNRNGNVTYSVNHSAGLSQTVESHKIDGGQWNLIGTYNFSGNGGEYVEVSAVSGNNFVADAIRFEEVDPGVEASSSFVHNDHLGTPQVMTNSSQQVVWSGEYLPFGVVAENVTTVANPIRFPGQYANMETGDYYNYFRTYDPSIGRYATSDPIGLAGGLNTYAYVGANPVVRIDIYGLQSTTINCECRADPSSAKYDTGIKTGKWCDYACSCTCSNNGKEFEVTKRAPSLELYCFGQRDVPSTGDFSAETIQSRTDTIKLNTGGPVTQILNGVERVSNVKYGTLRSMLKVEEARCDCTS